MFLPLAFCPSKEARLMSNYHLRILPGSTTHFFVTSAKHRTKPKRLETSHHSLAKFYHLRFGLLYFYHLVDHDIASSLHSQPRVSVPYFCRLRATGSRLVTTCLSPPTTCQPLGPLEMKIASTSLPRSLKRESLIASRTSNSDHFYYPANTDYRSATACKASTSPSI